MTVKPPDSGGFFLCCSKELQARIAAVLKQDCHRPVTRNQALGANGPDFAVSRVNGFI
jgi:hypothetical protein